MIKAQGSYIDGNENTKITWLEYSDLQCPYCAQLYVN
ncbi:MAG: DsbA family protein [Candidatus Peribacteria bacterium]|nr:DsbA family protein [Candidatus Peribacteria bacterium]